jgi:hypothetical protein
MAVATLALPAQLLVAAGASLIGRRARFPMQVATIVTFPWLVFGLPALLTTDGSPL